MVILPVVAALGMVAAAIARREYLLRERAKIQKNFLRVILLRDPLGERYVEELAQYAGVSTKRIAAEVIADLAPIIYRMDVQYIETLTRRLHLDRFLMVRCRHSSGVQLLHYLLVISRLPLARIDVGELLPYLRSSSRMTRFFALLAVINVDRGNIIRYIAAYAAPLTAFELSQLLSMLRLGGIAVAYQPMLSCDSVNVQLLGVAVVHHFGVVEADKQLREIISRGSSLQLRLASLFAIASMHLLLCTPSILHFVRSLQSVQRRRFLRYITYEGYSRSVVSFFVGGAEVAYYQSIMSSYKVKI